jgi:hypothetical protein
MRRSPFTVHELYPLFQILLDRVPMDTPFVEFVISVVDEKVDRGALTFWLIGKLENAKAIVVFLVLLDEFGDEKLLTCTTTKDSFTKDRKDNRHTKSELCNGVDQAKNDGKKKNNSWKKTKYGTDITHQLAPPLPNNTTGNGCSLSVSLSLSLSGKLTKQSKRITLS